MTKIYHQDQILDAASKVFAEKGYAATRLQDIAAELGVLQGSLYYHIGSKAGLLRLLRVRRFTTIADRIAEINADPGTAQSKLRLAMRAHLAHFGEYLAEAPQWFTAPRDPARTRDEEDEDNRLTAGYRASWKTILQQGIDSGEVRADIDLGVTVMTILGMLNWVPNWFVHEGRCTIDEVAQQQFELVWRALSA